LLQGKVLLACPRRRDREVLDYIAAVGGILFHRKKLDGATFFLQAASLRPKAASIKLSTHSVGSYNPAALAPSSPVRRELCPKAARAFASPFIIRASKPSPKPLERLSRLGAKARCKFIARCAGSIPKNI
jgi:hypothetical protein